MRRILPNEGNRIRLKEVTNGMRLGWENSQGGLNKR